MASRDKGVKPLVKLALEKNMGNTNSMVGCDYIHSTYGVKVRPQVFGRLRKQLIDDKEWKPAEEPRPLTQPAAAHVTEATGGDQEKMVKTLTRMVREHGGEPVGAALRMVIWMMQA